MQLRAYCSSVFILWKLLMWSLFRWEPNFRPRCCHLLRWWIKKQQICISRQTETIWSCVSLKCHQKISQCAEALDTECDEFMLKKIRTKMCIINSTEEEGDLRWCWSCNSNVYFVVEMIINQLNTLRFLLVRTKISPEIHSFTSLEFEWFEHFVRLS